MVPANQSVPPGANRNAGKALAWLIRAREYFEQENSKACLSAARNALRLDVKNLSAWHLASDVLMQQNRYGEAARYAKRLKRFALAVDNSPEVEFASSLLKKVEAHFATQHLLRGETDLTYRVGQDEMEQVRTLLETGVDVNERNRSNWSALHCAAMRGRPEMVRLLCQYGASLEAEDDLKETPLLTACRFDQPELIPVLLEFGADVCHVSQEKHTALWYAISSMKNVSIVQLLIESGANPNEEYRFGDNPFLVAVAAQNAQVVNFLLPLTKEPDRMNQHQVCALRFAASYNDTDLIQKLLGRGVFVDHANDYGHTPLMSAAGNNSLQAAQILLAHGADPCCQTKYGESAISIARDRSNVELLQLLEGSQGL